MQIQDFLIYISLFSLGLFSGTLVNPIIHYLPKLTIFLLIKDLHELDATELNQNYVDKYEVLPESNKCPKCAHKSERKYSLELLNYIATKGVCRRCIAKIDKRHALVEIACGIATVLVFMHAEYSIKIIPELLFAYCMVSIIFMDIQTKIIPDAMILPLIWLGLSLSLFGMLDISVKQSLSGAIAGYISLWGISKLASILARSDEIAKGDFKLMAVWGSWFGATIVPQVVLLIFVSAALSGLIGKRKEEIALAPYIILGWVIAITFIL